MPYRTIMRVVPTIQAASLAKENAKMLKKKKPKLVKQGVKNIVGVNLIKTQADLVAGL